MSDRFDSTEESKRVWLDRQRRSTARRWWLLIGALVLVAIVLAWLTIAGQGGGQAPTATTTTPVDQRALADGQQALSDWGRFAVTNDLRMLEDSFWINGPQYQQLKREAEKHPKPIGPPPYMVKMTDVQVKNATRSDERILRGRVVFTRPGEAVQTYFWDIRMRRENAAGGRWRLWTVQQMAAR